MKRGQGTFEYVLLLGGVLLIVVLAIVVLQNTAQQSFQGAGKNQCSARVLTDISCNNATGYNACGQVDTAQYVGCGLSTAVPAGCGAAFAPAVAPKAYCGAKPV